MADWKQIQARIHRARAGADPAGQLQKLFEKTHDAMAAFELARHLEGAGQPAEAARWYATAAERFRRADWKKKAEEAAGRLKGDAAPAGPLGESPDFIPPSAAEGETEPPPRFAREESAPAADAGAESHPVEQPPARSGTEFAPRAGGSRRRGRRGGRGRRQGREVATAIPETPAVNTQRGPAEPPVEQQMPPQPSREFSHEFPRSIAGETTGTGIRGRSGDPALSSRLAHLEMQLRRLLACPPAQLEHADRAPAGPGVFLVSDSDQITNYYSDACATLRIGIGNLLRSGAARRGAESVKPRFAEHLGIPESRVTKYLKDHCVVRWLQLDENSAAFAHFVVAILHPVLND
jgi:hypothetical protein